MLTLTNSMMKTATVFNGVCVDFNIKPSNMYKNNQDYCTSLLNHNLHVFEVLNKLF